MSRLIAFFFSARMKRKLKRKGDTIVIRGRREIRSSLQMVGSMLYDWYPHKCKYMIEGFLEKR